ncbi:hypothetical protein [Methylophaga sp.]|uniref:hypothetical protein n=1 Tax=Methylophaga sp. TaxID=2024840 RepID=UPI003A8F328C
MSQAIQKPSRPIHPYLVLIIAILLPGVGQVLNHAPIRGLMMVFFMMVLGVITFNLADPDVSLIGKFAGGVFIYAISIMDAYMWARLHWALAQQK